MLPGTKSDEFGLCLTALKPELDPPELRLTPRPSTNEPLILPESPRELEVSRPFSQIEPLIPFLRMHSVLLLLSFTPEVLTEERTAATAASAGKQLTRFEILHGSIAGRIPWRSMRQSNFAVISRSLRNNL